MLILNIIMCVCQRVLPAYELLFFILNLFSVYCCFTFAYVDLHFKFIPQIMNFCVVNRDLTDC